MLWLLSLPLFWFVGRKVVWLHSLDVTLKKHRRMRTSVAPGDAAALIASQPGPTDGGELESRTRELQKLGFVFLGDLLTKLDFDPPPPKSSAPIPEPHQPNAAPNSLVETETNGVGRIFAHPTYGCYAGLISVVSVSRFAPHLKRADLVNVAPFRIVVTSMTGTREADWVFATHNREADPFSLLLRAPRGLSRRIVGARAAQLLQSHLSERDDIAGRGDFRWDKELSFEKYQQFEARAARYIRAVYEKITTVKTALFLMTWRLKKHDLRLGELETK